MSKVCFVVTTPFTVNGFLINHLFELAKLHEVTLCVNLDQYELSPQLDTSNLNIINVPLERKISPWSDLKSWWILFGIFSRYRFDSVHSVTPKAGLLGMSSAFFARIPRRFHTFTGQIWSNRSGSYRFVFKHVDWLIDKFATLIFADSASQIQFLVKERVCPPTKITMLGAGSISGVDLSRFQPNALVKAQLREELAVNENDCVYLFVGRLCRDKGLFDLLAAFTKIRAQKAIAILWVVGPDEEGVISRAQDLFPESYHLIKWIGPTFSPERYMQAADVLVLPSYREGFGSVIIEAAACQLPTIAYRIDGVIDAVVDEKSGLLVEVGNIKELERQMELLSNNPTLRKELGHFAKERACNEFSSETVSRAWLNFYEDALNKNNPFMNLSKRAIDLAFSVVAGVLLIVPMIFVALLIRLTSKGPILYWSDRVGYQNQVFSMPKFRSMKIGTPALATHLLDDPKQYLTAVGRFLRRSSLDELPQIWSIFKGDMSLVGPRPALYNQQDLIDLRNQNGVQFLVPGLTGWAQVNGRDELPIPDKVRFDVEYLHRQSFLFDLKILWMTGLKVINKDGVSH